MAPDISRRVTFVLGGARSGKSAFAERLAREDGIELHYIATGQAFDDEMRARIARHREDRGEAWITHEVTTDLAGKLAVIDAPDRVILIDCLTLWITNLMLEDKPVDEEGRVLVSSLSGLSAHLIFVSNEVGLGIVPENKMARDFRDHAGRLHQALAAAADEVYFIAAGLPLKMKG